tara:strand:- start:2331 stop:2945 length:615 start_codon:yes stop_codon:yes gene_type:complete
MTNIPNVDCDLWFPTPVYRIMVPDHEQLNKQLLPMIRKYQSEHKSIQGSNILGYHSDSNLQWEPIARVLCDTMRKIEKAEALTQPCDLVELWFNINPPQSHNASHTHPRCDWSGVYYVQTPPDSGMLHLEDPRDRAHMTLPLQQPAENTPPTLWRTAHYQPTPGLLLFFPSWLSHSVGVNLQEQKGNDADRISMSFNFVQRWFQ